MVTTCDTSASVEPPEFATLRVQAPAKINLRLRIVGRRPDGYHLLDSYVAPVSIFDRLDIRLRRAHAQAVSLVCDHPLVPVSTDNLAVRAALLFLERTSVTAAVSITLEKEIPIGAGLGGGSSDAASMLVALDQLLGTRIPRARLAEWAVELGADVPFFVHGLPARVSGIGDVVDIDGSPPRWPLVVVFPGVALRTAEVYAAYDRSLTNAVPATTIYSLAQSRLPLQELLANDLEAAAMQILPVVQSLKERLRDLGAVGALMTGSGSAVFGVWEQRAEALAAAQQMNRDGIWARAVEILDGTPGRV